MLTVSEVRALFENYEFRDEYKHWETGETVVSVDSGWNRWDELEWEDDKSKQVPGLGLVEVAEFDTGGEGHGEYVYMVFKVSTEDGSVRYFKKNGYYSSYEGTEWDGYLKEVTPKQKTVTVYE